MTTKGYMLIKKKVHVATCNPNNTASSSVNHNSGKWERYKLLGLFIYLLIFILLICLFFFFLFIYTYITPSTCRHYFFISKEDGFLRQYQDQMVKRKKK
jgi:hypothetical protein